MSRRAADVSLGRRLRSGTGGVVGYEVMTILGERAGVVAATTEGSLIVETRRWPLRERHALPVDLAVVREIDRTIVMLVSREELRATARVTAAADFDDSRARAAFAFVSGADADR